MSFDGFSRLDAVRVQARLGSEGPLRWFVEAAWPIIEPQTPFKPGKHIDLVCEHLEAFYRREIRNLVINMPPGHMKSLLCSVFYNAWVWIRDPSHKFLCGSFDLELPKRDGGKIIQILQSEWFRERWGDRVRIVSQKDKRHAEKDPSAARFFTNAGGLRLSVSPQGKGTGWHANTVTVDDPIKPTDCNIGAIKRTNEWFSGTLSTRKSDPATFGMLLVMQRLHERDASEYCVKELGFEQLVLPLEYDKRISIGPDWRKQPGEILWPEVHSKDTIAEFKRGLKTPRNIAAQAQQKPTPDEGIVFKSAWFDRNRFRELPEPHENYRWIQTWDLTFDDEGDDPDYVCGGVWAFSRTDAYLFHRVYEILDFPTTVKRIMQTREAFPLTRGIYIEKKANGAGVIKTLRLRISGVDSVDTGGVSKLIRAHSVTHLFEGRNVWVRDEPWADEWQANLIGFPRMAHDDDVDMTVYALRKFEERVTTAGDALKAAEEAGLDVASIMGL